MIKYKDYQNAFTDINEDKKDNSFLNSAIKIDRNYSLNYIT